MTLRELTGHSTDIIVHPMEISGISSALIFCDGMIKQELVGKFLSENLGGLRLAKPGAEALLQYLFDKAILASDQKPCNTMEDVLAFIMSGFVVILCDGANHGIACGLQGYAVRSPGEPDTEMNLWGAREGFVEAIRSNQAMIRRRMKTPQLTFELYPLNNESKTEVSIVYRRDKTPKELVERIKEQLSHIKIDTILSVGYIQPFLEGSPLSLFSRVGKTERPDVLCGKIAEGRIGILLDGVPFALIVPFLFEEHFQSLDDYAFRPYYTFLIRILKLTAFLLSILLPGMYVALSVFDPEFLPDQLLFTIVSAEQATPFPMMLEAILIHFIYEIMREAGLRLPRPVGHAVGIVGALVIGDAAVNAGLVGSPMVMIVALTALSSFVVPSLYEAVSVLKFVFIIVGGTLGLYGIALALMALLVNLCALSSEGIPVTTPVAPFSKEAMGDLLWRRSWRKKENAFTVDSMYSSHNKNNTKEEADG